MMVINRGTMEQAMNDKQRAANQAARLVENDMLVGLGTGSTANCFIEELARLSKEDGLRITTVASSVVSTIKARELGLPQMAIEQVNRLDLYVDGADEVTPNLTLLKGRGYDLVREKLLAEASDKFLVLVDQSKLVDRIGERFPVPVEVMPFAWQLVKARLETSGARGELRQTPGKDGYVMTAYGSLVLDMVFDADTDSETLDDLLNSTPGIVEHGIFRGLTSAVFVAAEGQVEERWAVMD